MILVSILILLSRIFIELVSKGVLESHGSSWLLECQGPIENLENHTKINWGHN